MAQFSSITYAAFKLAIDEARSMTREEFRKRYNFGKSRTYVAMFEDVVVDPKALLAAAHHHQFPDAPMLTPSSFSSSAKTRSILEKFDCIVPEENELVEDVSSTLLESRTIPPLATPLAAWWVNQSENFDVVYKRGTLWVPLADKGGNIPNHWAAIHELRPSDLILHRYNNRISGLSTVITTPVKQPKPVGYHDAPGTNGFLVLLNPVGHVSIPESLLLDNVEVGTGPINAQGKLSRKYISPLPIEMTLQVLRDQGVDFTETVKGLNLDANIDSIFDIDGSTDRLTMAQSRVEQSFLRAQLLSNDEIACALCGKQLPEDLLVAGHIKKRSKMPDSERLDFEFNSMLVCVLGCDSLYEKGYISVDDRGLIQGTKAAPETVLGVIEQLAGRPCPKFGPKSSGYFRWHWQNVFHAAM